MVVTDDEKESAIIIRVNNCLPNGTLCFVRPNAPIELTITVRTTTAADTSKLINTLRTKGTDVPLRAVSKSEKLLSVGYLNKHYVDLMKIFRFYKPED